MPSRIVQTLCSALFVLILLFMDKTTERSLWLLIPAGILVIGSFVFGKLINKLWYHKRPPKLDSYEINWIYRFLPYFKQLDSNRQVIFCQQLAMELTQKDFSSMAEKKMPEELKLMALGPAIRLQLLYTNPEAHHYHRIIFYHHAFPSPSKQYLHISETEHEDGVLIFASDALELAHANPDLYFNAALYEWSSLFIKLNKISELYPIESSTAWLVIQQILGTEKAKLEKYMGQINLDELSILVYCYLMYPEKLLAQLPDFFHIIKTRID